MEILGLLWLLQVGLVLGQEGNILSFDDAAMKYVEAKAAELGKTVDWWDLYGEQPSLKSNPEWSSKKIKITTEKFVYSDIKIDNDFRNIYGELELVNEETKPIVKYLENEIDLHRYATWYPKQGIRFKVTTGAKVTPNLPEGMDDKSLDPEDIVVVGVEDTLAYDEQKLSGAGNITVEPNSAIKVEWNVIQDMVEASWTTQLSVEGFFAVTFTGDSEPQFFPITEVSDPSLQLDNERLLFKASGTFQGFVPKKLEPLVVPPE